MIQEKDQNNQLTQTKYRLIRTGVVVLTFILLLAVAIIPGVLRILYRADAQVALGHAKSVRLALQITGTEEYGRNGIFCDASHEGGVTESVWKDVLTLSKAPGDFWVLQVEEDGYTVKQFVYQEGEFTVWYQSNPVSYTVYHNETMIEPDAEQDE